MSDETSRAARLARLRFPLYARDVYRHEGWRIVESGTVDGALLGLNGLDWHPDTFAARKNQAVELPLLVARYPGSGAFGRLVERLESQGFRVTVATPLGEFREHLARGGWIIDSMGPHGEIWRRSD